MHTNGTVLRTRNLSKRFGAVTALENFTVDVRYGEWISIMGPSGSGKTTLLNLLACLDPPTEGEYSLDGIDTATVTEKERAVIRREKIGLIFQQFHLVPYLTALENVMLAQYYHSMICEEDCLNALERVGLGHRLNHLPSQLSGGEQQRVCIARALINEPAIILADEPTGNLDEENERVVLRLFEDLHAEGRTIVLVTHNPSLGEEAERMVILQHGKIKEIVTKEDAPRCVCLG
jgi:putative ABC transport system ATP-binding protein